jgi:GTP diphosphokinase / guanosine-3',5'-bis(diphosphate) 3'-diphosphatase
MTKLRGRFKAGQLKPVEAAIKLATSGHAGVRRGTGEPYVCHPLAVAEILSEWKLDLPTIVAAVLHDLPEDTKVSFAEIERQFGEEVAKLVEGVTKLAAVRIPQADIVYEVENLRRLFLAMAQDLRVVLLKLADRLHNIRTIEGIPAVKRQRFGRETLEIFAPLADRLGMGEVRFELAETGFQYAYPKEHDWTKRQVQDNVRKSQRYLGLVKRTFSKELAKERIKAEIDARVKNLYSLYRKLVEKQRDIDKVYDLFAIRIIVDTVERCYQSMGVIHRHWQPLPHRIKDYIAVPKLNGYRSLHTTVFGPGNKLVEVQFRTQGMHDEAEHGVAAHAIYETAKRSVKAQPEQVAVMKQLKSWQGEIRESTEFIQRFKLDLFADRIFIFTPKGALYSLPRDATPVDFAYAVHTDVGHRCRGAKVNGVIAPLNTQLGNGDVVEVITRRELAPKRDWLGFVRTGHARSAIRRFLRQHARGDNLVAGRELLATTLKAHDLSRRKLTDRQTKALIDRVPGAKSLDDVIARLGEGQLTTAGVLRALGLTVAPATRRPVRRPGRKASVVVSGASDLPTKLAACCRPRPGTPIIGYATVSKVISIHAERCPQVANLPDPSRLVAVSWQE